MNFKRYGRKVFGVQFNKAEQAALDREINRQIVEHDRRFDMDKEASILWMLHARFGFGAKRLRDAWEMLYAETVKLREYYELDQKDDGWIARLMLKNIGVDLEEWYREYDAGEESGVQLERKEAEPETHDL